MTAILLRMACVAVVSTAALGQSQPTPAPQPTRPPRKTMAPGAGLFDMLVKDPDMATFVKAITAVGYDRLLQTAYSKYTVFAPNNKAFGAVPNLDKILANRTLLFSIIREHIVSAGYKGEPTFSTDLEDGGVFRSLGGQGIVAHGSSSGGWVIANIDGSSKGRVISADHKAGNGVYHTLDGVLLPVQGGKPYTPCTKKRGPCPSDTNPDVKCRVGPESFPPEQRCALSKVLLWGYSASCCIRQCEYRTNGGVGDVCKTTRPPATRPTPATLPTTTKGEAACPASCTATVKACLDKGYSTANCLQYASKGYLCKGADGKALPCNGQGILPAANTPTCPDVQAYATCGGCQATCENPRPMCTRMCHAGCFCPRDKPIFDDAQGKCITFDACPAANQCEATIKADYLDSGNLPATCADNSEDGVCTAACESSMCVPRRNFPAPDAMAAYCKRQTQTDCGVKSATDPRGAACEWAAAAPAGSSGPTFVCSVSDAGDAAWAVQDEGACSAGGGVSDSVCDYLQQTACLDKEPCSRDLSYKCQPLVTDTVAQCRAACFLNSHKDKKCGGCLIDKLFNTNTLGLDQPDIFTCCGCLDDTFAVANLDNAQLHELLAAPCKKHSVTNDDDDVDDDDDDK